MKSRSVFLSALITLGGLPASSYATQVNAQSTLNWVTVMSANGGWPTADTVFTLTNGTTGNCDGFWVRPSDPGYQTTYAMLLAAQATQRTVNISAFDDQLWTGSSTRYCLVYSVRMLSQ